MVGAAEGIVIEQGATIGFRRQLRRVWIDYEHMALKLKVDVADLCNCYASIYLY